MALGQKIISSTLIRAEAVTLISKVPTSTSSISVAAAVVALLVRGAHFLCQLVRVRNIFRQSRKISKEKLIFRGRIHCCAIAQGRVILV